MKLVYATSAGEIDLEVPRNPGESADDQFHRVAAVVRTAMGIPSAPEIDPRRWAEIVARARPKS